MRRRVVTGGGPGRRRASGLAAVAWAVALAAPALVPVAPVLAPPTASAQPTGDAVRGEQLFVAKACARCHRTAASGAMPALQTLRRPQGSWELAGRMWNHAPAMFMLLTQEGLAWPQITVPEMADLMAYLSAHPARDPAPDLVRGQLTLIAKGCLKCHAFRREGARLGPDLADQRPAYGAPAAWAAAMWTHTPRMAAVALQRGFLYPRFTGDELINLVGFLRSGRGAP